MISRLPFFLLLTVSFAFAQPPDTLWTRTYGENPHTDECLRIIKTYDGGFFLGGRTWSVENAADFFVVKTDSLGEEQWTGRYRWELHDLLYGIAQTPDSGFVMSGSLSEGWLAKVDADGNLEWANGYAGDGGYIQDLKISHDGQIIAVGLNGNGDAYLALIDDEGDVVWDEAYGGRGTDRFWRVIITRDNGLVMVGSTRSFGNGVQAFIVKTDSAGREEWTRDFGGPQIDGFNSVVETEDGGFANGGTSESEVDGDPDFFVVKVNADGDEVWSRTYPQPDSDYLYDLIGVPGGGFLLVGEESPDDPPFDAYVAYRLDAEGEVLWELDVGDIGRGVFTSAVVMDDGSYAIAGRCRVRPYHHEFWLVRTEPDPLSFVALPDPSYPSEIILLSPFPNPFNSTTTISYNIPNREHITLRIFDLSGREVTTLIDHSMDAGHHKVLWNADAFQSGLYLVKLSNGGQVRTAKMVCVK